MLKILAALVLAACANHGRAGTGDVQSGPVVGDPKVLMVAAIDSPTGRSAGVLGGDMAAVIGKHFQTSTPVNIEVRTLSRYAQEGCRRLAVLFWQEGVLLPNVTERKKETIEFGINYCRDGQPPRSLALEHTP